jgi:hypothetical protein
MKKKKFAPLSLDKETVNLLDKRQLKGIKGGYKSDPIEEPNSTGCTQGGSNCGTGGFGNGHSIGCNSGGSICN